MMTQDSLLGECTLLLTLTGVLWNLPSVRGETCNSNIRIRPDVDISSSPKNNRLPIGAYINLTCSAEPRKIDSVYLDRWVDYVEWYDPQGRHVGAECRQPSNVHHHKLKLSCSLVLKNLTVEKFGPYTCQAGNGYVKHCTRKSFEIGIQGAQIPEIVEGPKNQSVLFGSNVTFSCTAKGLPRPTIHWIKVNASHILRTNPRARVIQDSRTNRSQLLITGVEMEDYGKYQCISNNSFGKSQSEVVILNIDVQKPEIVEGPKSQRVSIGSNASFSCTVKGLPRPTIYWIKNNASDPLQSNSRASVIQEGNDIRSLLLIVGVREEDGGRYKCIASNSAGRKESEVVFLILRNLALISAPSENGKPKNSASQTTIIAVSCTLVVAAVICVVIGFVWIRRRNRDIKGRKRGTEVYFEKGKHLPNGIQDLENDWSPNTQTIKIPEERRPLVGDGVGERGLPDGSEQDDTMQDIEKTGQERLDSGEKIVGADIFTADKFVDLGVDEQRKILSKETKEGCENLENLEVFDEILGEGEFGIVYKGRYGGKDGNMTDVAVKKLKDPSAIAKETLFNEIRTLRLAGTHPNIVTLIGTRIEGGNVLVVTELIHGGSLENLLKAKRAPGENNNYHNVCCKLNDRQLVTIAFQIAAGMKHLEERKFVHRDLAARNILVDANLVAKVGDFGLARDISEAGIYTITSNGKVPWRWSSLESLRDLHFTSMSDVWSFGIVLWEIATYGELPYPDISSAIALVSRLATGYRMPRPDQCSEELYELMSSCWKENPMMRPAFSQIAQQLKNFLREVKRTYINITEENKGEA